MQDGGKFVDVLSSLIAWSHNRLRDSPPREIYSQRLAGAAAQHIIKLTQLRSDAMPEQKMAQVDTDYAQLQRLRGLIRAAVWPSGRGMQIDTAALRELMRLVHDPDLIAPGE
jgi:hypothetical protein